MYACASCADCFAILVWRVVWSFFFFPITYFQARRVFELHVYYFAGDWRRCETSARVRPGKLERHRSSERYVNSSNTFPRANRDKRASRTLHSHMLSSRQPTRVAHNILLKTCARLDKKSNLDGPRASVERWHWHGLTSVYVFHFLVFYINTFVSARTNRTVFALDP